jgi:hypothetical protein
MDARCHIDLLGGLRVLQGPRIITRFQTQKTASLLAYLVYYPDQAHPREVLIEHFLGYAGADADAYDTLHRSVPR